MIKQATTALRSTRKRPRSAPWRDCYAATYTWAYFAWYRGRERTEHLVLENDGWFGANTYAGGADKLGHAWASYAANRLTTRMLRVGGWGELPSGFVGSVTSMGFFTFIEIKDGFNPGTGFSWGDLVFDAAGNALALAFETSPSLDAMFDFKVYYRPTDLYLQSLIERGVVDAGEDYSGQQILTCVSPQFYRADQTNVAAEHSAVRGPHGELSDVQLPFRDRYSPLRACNRRPSVSPSTFNIYSMYCTGASMRRARTGTAPCDSHRSSWAYHTRTHPCCAPCVTTVSSPP